MPPHKVRLTISMAGHVYPAESEKSAAMWHSSVIILAPTVFLTARNVLSPVADLITTGKAKQTGRLSFCLLVSY